MSIEAVFFPADNPNSKYYGYGSIKIEGFSINYTVYQSNSDSGIFVALPSRKKLVNGKEVLKDGKPEYTQEVWIDKDTRVRVDEAVINAMSNRGVSLKPNSHNFDSVTTKDEVVTKIDTSPSILEESDEDLPF